MRTMIAFSQKYAKYFLNVARRKRIKFLRCPRIMSKRIKFYYFARPKKKSSEMNEISSPTDNKYTLQAGKEYEKFYASSEVQI